ncbi:MAG: hypothetical protein ACFFBD_18210 [Candidatus Hodarchaeota archaeon]
MGSINASARKLKISIIDIPTEINELRSMRSENRKSAICESHEYVDPDENICKDGHHICIWCGAIVDMCDCFEGAGLSVVEENILKEYLFQVEKILKRDLRPTEKQAVIQQFLDLKTERI